MYYIVFGAKHLMKITWWNIKQETSSYHAAPTTDNEMERPTPIEAHMYGDVCPRNLELMKKILDVLQNVG